MAGVAAVGQRCRKTAVRIPRSHRDSRARARDVVGDALGCCNAPGTDLITLFSRWLIPNSRVIRRIAVRFEIERKLLGISLRNYYTRLASSPYTYLRLCLINAPFRGSNRVPVGGGALENPRGRPDRSSRTGKDREPRPSSFM